MPLIPETTNLGPVKNNVQQLCAEVITAAEAALPGHTVNRVWGFNAASKPEHSAGTALDFMVYSDRQLGDWIADYLWANRSRLGLRWEIWQQAIRSTSEGKPGTWVGMADRGSSTQNHRDHVHANFWEKAYVPPAGGSSTPPPPAAPVRDWPAEPIVQGYQGNVYFGKLRRGQGDSDSVRVYQRALRNYPGISTIPLNPSGVTGYYGSETEAMTRKMYTTLNDRYPGKGWGDGDLGTPGRGLLYILGCRIVG